MTAGNLVDRAGLTVATSLAALIEDAVLPGLPVTAEAFWSGRRESGRSGLPADGAGVRRQPRLPGRPHPDLRGHARAGRLYRDAATHLLAAAEGAVRRRRGRGLKP